MHLLGDASSSEHVGTPSAKLPIATTTKLVQTPPRPVLRSYQTANTMSDSGGTDIREYDLIRASLDYDFYCQNYPDVCAAGVDPTIHYLKIGWKLGYDPSPSFSTRDYLQRHPDVECSGQNPLVHYGRQALSERLPSAPLPGATVESGRDLLGFTAELPPASPHNMGSAAHIAALVGQELDVNFYISQLRELKIDPTGLDLPAHYVEKGSRAGLAPTKWFSAANYLALNPDIAELGVNPFYHYLRVGRGEGRQVILKTCSSGVQNVQSSYISDYELLRNEFDVDYYLSEYTEFQGNHSDLLWHFVTTGWKEGRNPSSLFSTFEYLQMYPDVEQAGINPFAHYIISGRNEGRKPSRNLGFRYEILHNITPIEDRLKSAYRHSKRHDLGSADRLNDAFDSMQRSERRCIYLSVSHDNFTENVGGVQLCLQREAKAILSKDFDHLHFFPATPLPTLELSNFESPIGVLVNEIFQGYFDPTTIIAAIKLANLEMWRKRIFSLHSLLGHNAESIARIFTSLNMKKGFFWIHDFTAGCAGIHLMRNDVQFCGAPDLDSMACNVCLYKPYRAAHLEAHKALFDAFDLTLISPSETALRIWGRATGRAISGGRVHPHCGLVEREGASPRVHQRSETGIPLRIAFVGLPMSHKGWPVFASLARTYARDPRYKFFHFGARSEPSAGIEYVEVAASAGRTNQMMSAIEQHDIDVALIWSLCPETFCLTAYEAAASGAAIIAYHDSGNAASLASEEGRGLVLQAEHQLDALFVTGEVSRLSRRLGDARLFDLQYSGLTADFLEPCQ